MANNIEILILLQTKQLLEQELKTIINGSIEIRNGKYIYIHNREDGIPYTRYVGEYNDELYNQIISNNFLAKEYKSKISLINKELKKNNYSETILAEKVKVNIDFAKKNLVESIYDQAILEGISTTFIDTENIIEGGKVNNMTASDVLKIINLKHAWEFILNENVISSESNFNLLCSLNKFIIEGFFYSAGMLRNIPVTIGGTDYKPPIPIGSVIKEQLGIIINKKNNNVEKAVELLLFIMKHQIFIDGNKRTAVLFANHYLISKGQGIIVIPAKKVEKFKKLLLNYYETDSKEKIKSFLIEECYKNIV